MSKLTDLIKNKQAEFVEMHGGNLFYQIDDFKFPIPVEDLQGTCVKRTEKASVFMKWVKRALKEIEEGNVQNG
jgi:hypothetical protein